MPDISLLSCFVDLQNQDWKWSSSQSRKRFRSNSRSLRSFDRHETKEEEEGKEWNEVNDQTVTLKRRKEEQRNDQACCRPSKQNIPEILSLLYLLFSFEAIAINEARREDIQCSWQLSWQNLPKLRKFRKYDWADVLPYKYYWLALELMFGPSLSWALKFAMNRSRDEKKSWTLWQLSHNITVRFHLDISYRYFSISLTLA